MLNNFNGLIFGVSYVVGFMGLCGYFCVCGLVCVCVVIWCFSDNCLILPSDMSDK